MNGTSVRIVKGTVTEIDISGFGPNSAQLEFAITSEKNETFVVNFDAEPQFFASATTMLLMAYQTKTPIQISIPMDQQHPGETLKINGVKLPA